MYIICVATYLYRIVTSYVNRKIRRENNTYRRLSEGPAGIPPNCHVPYEQETRRENNIHRWLSEDPARICLPSVKLLFHDQGNTSGWLLLAPAHNEFLPTSPLKPIPWKSPTTFPSQGKISPRIKELAVQDFIRNCRLEQISIRLKNFLRLFYPEKRDSSERRDEGKDQSRIGWESQLKRMGCVVGVRWRIGGDGGGSGLGSRVSLSARVVIGEEFLGEWKK